MTKADHEQAAAHHARMANLCAASLKKARRMSDDDDDNDGGDGMDMFEAFCKSAMAEHASEAERHLECCKSERVSDLSKSDLHGDGIAPDGISAVIGEAPSGVVPILRYGQRELSKSPESEAVQKIFGEE